MMIVTILLGGATTFGFITSLFYALAWIFFLLYGRGLADTGKLILSFAIWIGTITLGACTYASTLYW